MCSIQGEQVDVSWAGSEIDKDSSRASKLLVQVEGKSVVERDDGLLFVLSGLKAIYNKHS